MNSEYNKAKEEFYNRHGENLTDGEADFDYAWIACKVAVLKILGQPIQNADLSWEAVDSRFIEKIQKL